MGFSSLESDILRVEGRETRTCEAASAAAQTREDEGMARVCAGWLVSPPCLWSRKPRPIYYITYTRHTLIVRTHIDGHRMDGKNYSMQIETKRKVE